MKKNNQKRTISTLIVLFIVFLIVPLIINWMFKLEAPGNLLIAEWDANGALAFYGTILASVATVAGVYLSIENAQRNYRKDEINKVKPYFALTHYRAHSRYNWLKDIPIDKKDKAGDSKEQDYYEEFKLQRVFAVLEQGNAHYKERLSDNQQHLLVSKGKEWVEKSSGNLAFESHPFISIPFEVENVGNGAAINTIIALYKKGENREGVNLYTIKVGDSFYFHVFCDEVVSVLDSEYLIEIAYEDITGNNYSQKYFIRISRDKDPNKFITAIDLAGKQELEKSV